MGETIWEEYCEQLKASMIVYFSRALADAIASGAPQSTIDHYSTKLHFVDFRDNLMLRADAPQQGLIFSMWPEWWDRDLSGTAGDAPYELRFPVPYASNSTLSVYAEWQFDSAWGAALDGPVTIRGTTAGHAGDALVVEGLADVHEYSMSIQATGTETFMGVEYAPDFEIHWKMSLNEGEPPWESVGTSSNVLYVTHAEPLVDELYLTLVHVGSKAAAGSVAKQAIFDGIWEKSAGLAIHQAKLDVSSWDVSEWRVLSYWGAGIDTQTGGSTASLLQHGHGRCQTWANFFVDFVQAQGIAGYQVIVVPPLPNATHLLVKNWEFIGNGSFAQEPIGALGFKYSLIDPPDGGDYPNDDLNKIGGIPAQGNDNPRSIFANHALVVYSASGQTRYYDPSYGLGPYDTLGDWGIDALAGSAIIGGQHPDLPPGHVQFAVKKLLGSSS